MPDTLKGAILQRDGMDTLRSELLSFIPYIPLEKVN